MNTEEKIDLILEKIDIFLVNPMNEIMEWIPVSIVANAKGLTPDAVRKQLVSGEFEYGVDFKKPNGRILVNQGAIGRIQKKRRS